MTPTENYLDKYGPLIRILTSEGDYDYLAATGGYDRAAVETYRAGRREALRTYMQDLAQDFEMLVDAGQELARSDAGLAAKLVDTERILLKTLRHLRFRLFLEGLVPVPSPAPAPGMFRRWLARRLSDDKPVRDLLFSMDELGRLVGG
jgi:hypothetical protein